MISVIIPVYKVDPFLRQCLDSILNQTYHDLEILLIDDGSPDECGEICGEYSKKDKRIRFFQTENKGLSAARNLGIQEATGNYLGFVDSDDWIELDMYELLLKRLEETGADICICGFQYEYPSLTNASSQASRATIPEENIYTGTEILRALVDQKINNFVWNRLYRRELFQDIVFSEEKNYEDVEIIHKIMCKVEKVAVISSLEYHYRVRADSITKTYSAENLIDFADSHISRYNFFKDEQPDLFSEKQEKLLQFAADGISKVWRWWYGCSADEKQIFDEKIKKMSKFSREHFPLFGYSSWPAHLRITTFFMHSRSNISFAVLYALNQLFRKLWPEKSNVVIE